MHTQHKTPDFRERLLAALADTPAGGLSQKSLFRRLAVKASAWDQWAAALDQLENDGLVKRNRRGWFLRTGGGAAAGNATATITGVVSLNPRGFAFVAREDGVETDLFIPPQATFGTLSGDRVEVEITEAGNARGPAGRIVRILTPRAPEFIGELRDAEGEPVVRSLRRDLPDVIPVVGPLPADAVPGQWVEARLLRPSTRGEFLSAEVVRAMGPVGQLDRTLDAVAAEYQLPPPYNHTQLAAAAKLAPADLPREQMEELVVITIDPVDAKDFDDGISFQPGDTSDTAWVGVHIADVAAYIAPGSALDATAAERGFTSYLPGRTLPMLPGAIAGDRCSLIAGQSRLAHSVFFEVLRATGDVLRSRRCHTRIRVRQRLSFGDVQGFLNGGETPEWLPETRAALTDLSRICRVMRRRRAETEAFLTLSGTDVRVRCTENPPIIRDLVKEEDTEANALVEEFMLAANSLVAAELVRRRIPGVFRVHAEPKRSDLAGFEEWASTNFSVPVKRLASRTMMNRFLTSLRNSQTRLLLTQEFLRTLPRAAYAATPQLHFGLGKECYCHFTSPIRRYADLVVHQQLCAADRGEAGRGPADCEAIARLVTDLERRVDGAYFAANDRMKLHYLQDQARGEPGRLFEGLVARLTAEGITVFLPDYGMFAFLAGRAGTVGRGASPRLARKPSVKAGQSYKCGDVIVAQARRIDPVRGVLELEPARLQFRRTSRNKETR